MDTKRLPKQALQYKPKGRRSIGRPRKWWRDQLHLEDQGTGNTPNPSGTWWWWWYYGIFASRKWRWILPLYLCYMILSRGLTQENVKRARTVLIWHYKFVFTKPGFESRTWSLLLWRSFKAVFGLLEQGYSTLHGTWCDKPVKFGLCTGNIKSNTQTKGWKSRLSV